MSGHINTIDYPGRHDFVVVTSDGMRFNLSRTVLATTSSFFANLFTLDGPPSAQSSEEQSVIASERYDVLDSLFAISYSHPRKRKPNINTFSQIAELIRVADKYGMHHALDYLSSHLVLPRIQGTTQSPPFTVTHPLATLSLSMAQGFNLPARLALKEAVHASNSLWSTAFDDAELEDFTLDFRTLKKIHNMRNLHANTYTFFIANLQQCPSNPLCAAHLQDWKTVLLREVEEAPNSVAFSAVFYKGWNCGCRPNLASHNIPAFTRFIALQAAAESILPELR
jgi:BTB/POZ domain